MPGKPIVESSIKPKEALDKLLSKSSKSGVEHIEANAPVIEAEKPAEAHEEDAEGKSTHVPIECPEIGHGKEAYLAFLK